MEKKIEDYLHLYLPVHFMWIEDAVPFEKGQRGILEAKDLQYWDEYKKIILRPLSDMTDDEEGEYLRTVFNHEHTATMRNLLKDAEGVKYLLSKHFDLFGLIEAGLAIDKTKLK